MQIEVGNLKYTDSWIIRITFINFIFPQILGSVLKRIADWLGGIVDRCNEEMGAPYQKCVAAFNYAEGECK